ncbi:MAG: cytochrome c peroxidase [Pseudomonadota bacterium]
MRTRYLLIVCALIFALFLSTRSVSQENPRNPDHEDPVARGAQIFTSETFSGNGRVCSTCHEPDRFGTLTPEFVQEKYASDPDGPLFRAIDSDDGEGASYERLLQHATFRVVLDLPKRTPSGLGIRKCDDPANQTVVMHRGSPSVFNAALEQHLMHDGREGDDLPAQALSAVHAHAKPDREPTGEELAAIAAFQSSLFSHSAIEATVDPNRTLDFVENRAVLKLPEGKTPSEKRGRAFFNPDRQCGQCHSGPMLNRTSQFHPNGVGMPIESSFAERAPDDPNEKFRWCYVDLKTNKLAPGPLGTPEVFEVPVSDPGIGLTTGFQEFQLEDGSPAMIPNELLVGIAGPLFKIPTLWGTPDTAPYFHNNSAKTLDEVLDQYNFMFEFFPSGSFGLGCDKTAPVCLSEQDKADIVSYMQLLSFE